jgi:hypothetical protein
MTMAGNTVVGERISSDHGDHVQRQQDILFLTLRKVDLALLDLGLVENLTMSQVDLFLARMHQDLLLALKLTRNLALNRDPLLVLNQDPLLVLNQDLRLVQSLRDQTATIHQDDRATLDAAFELEPI